jgi:phospholipase/carboxylesterase
MTLATLETLEIQTGAQPVASIIVLHGLGADGNDFVPLAKELKLAPVGPVRFVFPHAPIRPVTINNGYRMRAWYDILGTDLVRREDETGLREAQVQVQALLDREAQRGIAPSRTVLMGFSQGAAVTLMTGLRAPQRLAGLAPLSGYLPLAATTAAERNAANLDVPIFMVHGSFDPVIALARATASRDALVALGYPVEWHGYAMDHALCAQEVEDLNRFLLKVLAPN